MTEHAQRPLWKPHQYQKRFVKDLVEKPHDAGFLDPGLGKTASALAALLEVRKNGDGNKALVIAPLRVCYLVWSDVGEVGKWRQFADLKVALLHGKDKEKRLQEDADLYVINFDGVRWLCDKDQPGGAPIEVLLKAGVDTVILDELSKWKNAQGKTFKLFKPYAHRRFVNRWGLTGSPAPNGLLDLFGQMLITDGGASLGPSIVAYRNRYFHPTGYMGYEWEINKGAEEQIYRAIEPYSITMRATDHLDLPQLVEQNIYVDLPKKAAEVYQQLEDDLFAIVDKKVVVATTAAVASGKCRQVASGGLYREEERTSLDDQIKREALHIHDEKSIALQELVDELQGQPLLVFYEFNHDLERIQKQLGGKVPVINSKLSEQKLLSIVADWNAGKIPVLCGHPAAMGHGLNLQGAGSHICWYTLTWNLELYDQGIRRVYRQGVKASRVFIHRLLARKTLDEVVAQVINNKRSGQNALFEALKELRATRKKEQQ